MGLNNRPKWIVAAAAAIAATSVGGVALANAGDSNSPLPDSLKLKDAVPVTASAQATRNIQANTAEAMFDVRSAPVVRAQDGSFTLATATIDTANTVDASDTVNSANTLNTTDTPVSSSGPSSSSGPGSGDDIDGLDTVNTANTLDTVASLTIQGTADASPVAGVDDLDTSATFDDQDTLETPDAVDTVDTSGDSTDTSGTSDSN